MPRLLLISLFAATACGPSVSSDETGGDDGGGAGETIDTETDAGIETGGSTGEDVIEPELSCSRGERVGCLSIEPGQPDLCLCRGGTIDVVRPQGFTDWEAGEIVTADGDVLVALVGANSKSEAGSSMSTWRAVDDRLELVDSTAWSNPDRHWLVGAVVPELGSAYIAGGAESGAAWVMQSMPLLPDLEAPYIAPREETSGSLLVHMGDFDGDGRVDLAITDIDRHGAETYTVNVQSGGGTDTVALVMPFPTTVDSVHDHAAGACDLDGDGASDWIHANEGKIAWGRPGVGLNPAAVSDFESNSDAAYVRCVDVDQDGRLDLLVTIDLWPDAGEAVEVHHQRADRSFAQPTRMSLVASAPHRGVRAARLFGNERAGLDLFNLQFGRLEVQRAIGPREYAEPRSAELDEDLDIIGSFDIDGDGRDELIGKVDWPYDPETDDPGEELMVLWVERA